VSVFTPHHTGRTGLRLFYAAGSTPEKVSIAKCSHRLPLAPLAFDILGKIYIKICHQWATEAGIPTLDATFAFRHVKSTHLPVAYHMLPGHISTRPGGIGTHRFLPLSEDPPAPGDGIIELREQMEPLTEPKVPRIIHQTWKDQEIPAQFRKYVQTWTATHPHWEYRLWTDEDNLELVKDHFPEYLKAYEGLVDGLPGYVKRKKISQADTIRYGSPQPHYGAHYSPHPCCRRL